MAEEFGSTARLELHARSSLDDAERRQAGDLPRDTGAVNDAHHAVDVLCTRPALPRPALRSTDSSRPDDRQGGTYHEARVEPGAGGFEADVVLDV